MGSPNNISNQFRLQEFPEKEYHERYNKCRSLMGEQGIEVLIVSDQMNCRYFTGFSSQTTRRCGQKLLPGNES